MIPLNLFVILYIAMPLLFLILRYIFKLRIFSLIASLYVILIWGYYVSNSETILVSETWIKTETGIQHVYNNMQLPLMPVLPVLNILIYLSFMVIDYAGRVVE